MNKQLKIAIIGCGLIGQRRFHALKQEQQILTLVDQEKSRAEVLAAEQPGIKVLNSWQEALSLKELDTFVVATTHKDLATISLAAINAGKNLLVEKPGAINASELEKMIKAQEETKVTVQVGYNHRFHPALSRAKELVQNQELGPLMFIRARYGHGARVGYENEWRANPEQSGGGELIDQGSHLIDLSHWFLGDFTKIQAELNTYFWKMPVEDNAFLSLENAQGQRAWLHASCTEWKNLFSFEIYGQKGKLAIEGLGGSYGCEKLIHYKMSPQMGPPETIIQEYPGPDLSWQLETDAFVNCVNHKTKPLVGLNEAYATLKVIDQVYKRSSLRVV